MDSLKKIFPLSDGSLALLLLVCMCLPSSGRMQFTPWYGMYSPFPCCYMKRCFRYAPGCERGWRHGFVTFFLCKGMRLAKLGEAEILHLEEIKATTESLLHLLFSKRQRSDREVVSLPRGTIHERFFAFSWFHLHAPVQPGRQPMFY